MAAPLSEASEDYGLGKMVGLCMAVECQAFRGFVSRAPTKSGDLVPIDIDEALSDIPAGAQTIAIPYTDASAWARVSLTRNSPVTVVLGRGRNFGVIPGEPVIVTSSERDTVIIRSLIALTDQLRRSTPTQISALVATLLDDSNPAITGYLYGYLVFGKTNYPKELAAALMSQLLGSLLNPVDEELVAAGFLVSLYPSLPPSAQAKIVSRLSELAQRSDLSLAKAAFRGLARIASLDSSVPSMIPAASLAKLEEAYSALVTKEAAIRDRSLEEMLGIKYR
jgi:hypothetical protein